ncbi:hypothetical protein EIP91_009150 [Steccherinum ochraceum]|uniref:Uncharacterized protein n=1 Tax=Steccherinum ochraceum TaxID=92696 RepID=A0A4V2MV49_9APHY|nr:hypothetical protein EIP91_009150 [Steccherinum ochraceum]
MSRGNREAVSGNIKLSMRDNYAEHGVDEEQPIGILTTQEFALLAFGTLGGGRTSRTGSDLIGLPYLTWLLVGPICLIAIAAVLISMASGEATIAFVEWWKLGKSPRSPSASTTVLAPRKKSTIPDPPELSAELPTPQIMAADPFTAEAYKTRTSLDCSTWSFQDIADGTLADFLKKTGRNTVAKSSSSQNTADVDVESTLSPIEMVVCSFALHLVESPSELFALLWELSLRSRWLIILAPHKKPELKMGWGWVKWDVDNWIECSMSQSTGEFLHDRVHCRVYRSVHIP